MARAFAFVLCGVLLLVPRSVPAQSTDMPTPGLRVRITAPSLSEEPFTGTLTALEGERLAIRLDGRLEPLTLPRTSVTRWEVSQGLHSNAGKGAAWGFLGGAAVGVGFAVADYDGVEAPLVLGALWGGLGAGVGALIGSLHKSERWQEIDPKPFRITVVPVPDGIGISAQFSFGDGRRSR